MPANWLYMDAKFPDFDGDISTEDKLAQVQNYLYLLVEQMRYTMQNLDTTNLNQTALNVWEEAITKPLYLLLEGEGERLTQLSVTADGLIIQGTGLTGGTVESFFDHRIAMAFSIAALVAEGNTKILDSKCVDVSYPTFYDTFEEVL